MTNLKDIRDKINDLDKEMLDLFTKRMKLSKEVIEYKIKNNLPILDQEREKEVINKNLNNLKNKELEKYYLEFITNLMNISKEYQLDLKERSE
jgi:monofunctional chorismate mutase